MKYIINTYNKESMYKVAYLLKGEIVSERETLVIVNHEDEYELNKIVRDLLNDAFSIEPYRTEEYVSNSEQQDFKMMKKELRLTNEMVAKVIGLTTDSVKTMTQPSKELPSWAKAMIYVWKHFSK